MIARSSQSSNQLFRMPVLLGMLVLWLSMPGGAALANPCEQSAAPPLVSVRAEINPASYDFTRGIAQLSADGNTVAPRHLPEFNYVLGTTAMASKSAWETTLASRMASDGTLCWKVDKLQITLEVHTKVYIAKEAVKGSCLWTETMKHEAKHVKIDQTIFPRLADTIRPSIVRKIARTYFAQNQAQAERDADKLMRTAIEGAIDSFLRKRNRTQLSIDTAEEYSYISHVCGNAAVAAAVKRAGLR
jgi:hypothetical protein